MGIAQEKLVGPVADGGIEALTQATSEVPASGTGGIPYRLCLDVASNIGCEAYGALQGPVGPDPALIPIEPMDVVTKPEAAPQRAEKLAGFPFTGISRWLAGDFRWQVALQDLIRSTWVSPAQIREVGQEYGDFLLDNWGVIAASLSVFSAAMAGALWLGLTPPGIAILLILGKLGLDAYKHELEVMQKHGVKWVELAVHANRNPQLLAEASKEYIQMWASFGMAITSVLGFLGPAKLGASFLARWNLDRLPAPRLTTNQVDAVPVGTVRDPDGTIISVYEVPASTHGRATTTATTSAAPPSELNNAHLPRTIEQSPEMQPVIAAFGAIPPVVDTLISEPFSSADPWPATVESTPSFSGGFYAKRSKMQGPPRDSPAVAQPQHVSALVHERGLPPVPVTSTRAEEKAGVLAKLAKTAKPARPTAFTVPERARFEFPSLIRAVLEFFNDRRRLVPRLQEIEDHALARSKDLRRFSHVVSAVLSDVETHNGIEPPALIRQLRDPKQRALIGALAGEMAANPAAFPQRNGKPPLAAEVVQELLPVWNAVFRSEAIAQAFSLLPRLRALQPQKVTEGKLQNAKRQISRHPLIKPSYRIGVGHDQLTLELAPKDYKVFRRIADRFPDWASVEELAEFVRDGVRADLGAEDLQHELRIAVQDSVERVRKAISAASQGRNVLAIVPGGQSGYQVKLRVSFDQLAAPPNAPVIAEAPSFSFRGHGFSLSLPPELAERFRLLLASNHIAQSEEGLSQPQVDQINAALRVAIRPDGSIADAGQIMGLTQPSRDRLLYVFNPSAELLNPDAAPRSRESFQSKNATELANLEPWLKETASRYKGFSRFSCGFASVSHAYALNVDSRGLSLLQLQRINRDYFTKVSAQGVLFDQVPEFEAFLKQIPGVTTQLVIAEYGAVNATIQTPVLRGIRNPEGVNGHWILDLGLVSPTEHLVSSADSHGVVEMKRISVSALKALINVQPEQNRNGPPAILLKFHSGIAPTASRFAPLRSGPNAQTSVPRASPTPKTRSANKGKDTTDPADVASFSGAPRRVNVDQPTFAEIADLQKVPGLSDADIDLLMRLVEAPMTSQAIEQLTGRALARDVVASINSRLRKAGRGAIVFDGLSHYHLRSPDQVLRMSQARTEVEAQMALSWRTIQTQHGVLQMKISQIDVALVERWFAKGVMTKQAIRDHLRLHLPRGVVVPEGAEDQLANRVHRALAEVSFDEGRVTTTVHGGRIKPMEDRYRLEFSAAPSAAKGDWGEVQIGGQPRYLRLKRSDLEWFQTFLDRGFCLTSDVSVAVVDRINTALKNGRESLNGFKTVDLGAIRPSDGPYARKRYEFRDTRSASDGTRTPWPSPGHAGRVRS